MDIYERDYLRVLRECRAHFAAHPHGTVVIGRIGWNAPQTRQQWNAQVVDAINARIEPVPESMGRIRDSSDSRWRSVAGSDWQVRAMRPWRNWNDLAHRDSYHDQQALHDRITRRIRVYRFGTATVRRRYGHLLTNREDE